MSATKDVGDQGCRATWEESGSPRESKWTPLPEPDASSLALPKTLKFNDRTILDALHQCGKTTLPASVKFALKRLQIQGETGQIAGTDGRQLLIYSGFSFPFSDAVLVPAVPIFGQREFAATKDVRIGKTATHVVVIGPWTIWLLIESEGRFPNVDAVIPRHPEHVLHLEESDRQKAMDFLAPAAKGQVETLSVTVEFGAQPALRLRAGSDNATCEIALDNSRCEGAPTTLVLNRDNLQRGLSLGLRDIRTPSENGPVVFQDKRRTYVVTALVPSQAIPAIRSRATAISRPQQVIPIPQGVHSMASETNGRAASPPGPTPTEALDFMAEAEGLRDAMFDCARRAGRLVALLKQLQKQRRVLETAWSSLKNLRLGS